MSGSALAGRRVALLHPAWHSCGTYRVVLGQIDAYRALGAEVSPIAVSTDPGFVPERRWIWKSFLAATPELDAGERHQCGAPFHVVCEPGFFARVVWPYLHGDQAAIRLGLVSRARLPPGVEAANYDLVHCNHFFLMPLARRLARGRAPILLDTHDLQARQFALINERMPWLRPRARYETMLAQELDAMRGADLLLHLNALEAEEFRAMLPEKRHTLLYPPTPPAPAGPGGRDIVIVSSNNTANVESLIWFLREVAPLAPGVEVKIAGSVEDGVRARAGDLHAAYRNWFLGRVADPAAIYAGARLVLLPTVSGTGLSIKTVEAMSSGLPLIATPQALRGMDDDARELPDVTVVETAEAFAAALRAAAESPAGASAGAALAYYEARFSLAAYRARLDALAAPLLAAAG
jgi:glycosyltransferase involved in cell wall biosynthesis